MAFEWYVLQAQPGCEQKVKSLLRVTVPTFSVFGRPLPFFRPAAFLSKVAAGVVFILKSNLRSS